MEENLSKMSLFSLAKMNKSQKRDQNVATKGLISVGKYGWMEAVEMQCRYPASESNLTVTWWWLIEFRILMGFVKLPKELQNKAILNESCIF